MPSNKNQQRLREEERKKQMETGNGDMIYTTVALCPVLENNEIIYKVMELTFTLDKKIVSMSEIDKCRTQGSALIKVETAFVNGTCNITQLRKTVRELKKEQSDE